MTLNFRDQWVKDNVKRRKCACGSFHGEWDDVPYAHSRHKAEWHRLPCSCRIMLECNGCCDYGACRNPTAHLKTNLFVVDKHMKGKQCIYHRRSLAGTLVDEELMAGGPRRYKRMQKKEVKHERGRRSTNSKPRAGAGRARR